MKKKIILIIYLLILILSALIVSYAFFTSDYHNDNKQEVIVGTGIIRLVFQDNDVGIYQKIKLGETIEKKFKIINTGTIDVYANILFKDLTNTYLDGSLLYTLSYSDSEDGEYTKILEDTNVPITGENKVITTSLVNGIKVIADSDVNSISYMNKVSYYKLSITFIHSNTVNQTSDLEAILSTGFSLEEGNKNELVSYMYMLEDGYQSNKYRISENNTVPSGYTYSDYRCTNGVSISWDDVNKRASTNNNNLGKCYIYFTKNGNYTVWTFAYNGTTGSNGSEQIFTVPYDGYYKLEVWGTQGGGIYSGSINNQFYDVGYGGYSSGISNLSKNTLLYINVGGAGTGVSRDNENALCSENNLGIKETTLGGTMAAEII